MPLSHENIIRTLFAARPRLSAAAWLVVRDAHAAEDIFQNVSVKALTRGVTFDQEAQLLSWAHVTARHEAIDWLRRQKSAAVTLGDEVLDLLDAEWSAVPASSGGRVDALRDCLDEAPHDARQMLEMRYFDGHSCAEVANRIGIGLDAVYQRLSRLHRVLKVCVERRLAGRDVVLVPNPEMP